jgi:hypothetical protein
MYGTKHFLSTGRFTLLLSGIFCVKFLAPTTGEQVITPEEMDNFEQEAAHERRNERRREAELQKNPDCRDPDHPGCEFCDNHDKDEET